MRISKLTNPVAVLFILLTIITLVFVTNGLASIETPCGTKAEVKLLAGQTIKAGTIIVANDDKQLCVTYQTTDGWYLTETHLHIAKSLADIPQTKKGNPIPGQFTYQRSYEPPVTEDEYCFDLSELLGGLTTGDTIYIAAHAAVVKLDKYGNIIKEETGWGEGPGFPGKNWAMYFTYVVQDCPPPAPEPCEDAFAYFGNDKSVCIEEDCFEDEDGWGEYNWGWRVKQFGLGTGEYVFDIYAGGSNCDPTDEDQEVFIGKLVGKLTVNYSNGTVTITYNMFNGYKLSATHLHVGQYPYPVDNSTVYRTIDPEKYPYKHENLNGASTDTYTINASDNIYVIAHALVCGDFSKLYSMAPSVQKEPKLVASLWGKVKSQY